jgi:hypothetical protein
MPNRRDVVAFGACAGLLAIADRSIAQTQPSGARLETRLFNFKDDVSEDAAKAAVARLKAAARSSGANGFLVGRNFIPDPFPARFEWIYMVQFDPAPAPVASSADDAFRSAGDFLASHCRNQVQCDLGCPLPPKYADAANVGVRHTVMFDFRPDASEEARTRNVEAIRAMGTLPMVRRYLVQPSAAPGSDPTQMQWQVVGDFASVADYRAYSAAPVHLAIREDFTAHTSRVAFLDVQL